MGIDCRRGRSVEAAAAVRDNDALCFVYSQ